MWWVYTTFTDCLRLVLLVTEQISFTWIYGPLLSIQMKKSAIYMPFQKKLLVWTNFAYLFFS